MARFISLVSVLIAVTCWPHATFSQSVVVPSHQVGLAAEKLERITEYLQRELDEGRIAGAVAAVSRYGRVGYLQAVGQNDLATGSPMHADTLFRIASMTKALTSASILSLVEDGQIALSDPLSKQFPEFAQPQVLKSIDGDSTETIPATGEPTIHDLLTHQSGLTYGWFGPAKLDAIYRQNNIANWFEPTDELLADRVRRIANVPLKFQPGSAWDYGVSTDVLGRVIEVASGLTLEQFFRERFLRPLQMHDTHFYVPHDKLYRVASLYTLDADKRLKPVGSEPETAAFLRFSADYCTKPGRFYSGGGGLVSSTTDYLRFLHMLLRGGELDGRRVLKRESVDLMTTNQIGEKTIPIPGHGDGFGYGFGVVTDRGAGTDEFSEGSYSWGGIFNTYFWVDPQEQLVGVLMTQVFPNDHLQTRAKFRQLAYEAIDDSGFEQQYQYQKGDEFANPHFNNRQLRVNAAEVSTHPNFASRSEPRSSGMARIRVDEDLRKIRRVDLATDIWGGHPGTANKRVTINGRSTYAFPEVGTENHHCTHQYPWFNLRPMDLVNGYNSLQFACDTGDTFWGHYIVDRAILRVGLWPDDARLKKAGLENFMACVTATPLLDDEGFALSLDVQDRFRDHIKTVRFDARYFGYDENGNGWSTDWHHGVAEWPGPQTQELVPPSTTALASWDTSMLPSQQRVEVRAVVELKESPDLRYRTPALKNLTIEPRQGESVEIFEAKQLPQPFWSRDNRVKECVIELDVTPEDIVDAELHVVAWTGGAGNVVDYFTLNGKHFPVAEGHEHQTVYTRVPVEPKLLKRGENKIVLRSDTKHHGIEIMVPGPALVIRSRGQANVSVTDSAPQRIRQRATVSVSSAKRASLACYRIRTPSATYYLDKVGAGLASIVDRDGHDWLSFRPEKGSGAAGEFRGFPNAVFKEAGSYFHPRNAGTDPGVTKIEESSPQRVVISATSNNGLWAGRFTFTESRCTFTMTKKPKGHNYWILYEGTPGGRYDDSDWWMTSAEPTKRWLTENHDGDIAGSEWIAFGDAQSPRMLVLHHEEGDSAPDNFYQMQKKMTVFGFGRAGMKKYLDSVPRSFSIGVVESTEPHAAEQFAQYRTSDRNEQASGIETNADAPGVAQYAQFALTHQGNAAIGKRLYHDQRTKCATCHRIGGDGGQVGPDLSSIGGKYDRPHLIDSLLYPSRQIGYGYETTNLLTVNGKTYSGIARPSDDDHVQLSDADNQVVRILRSEIEELTVAKTSIMPTGLTSALTEQEFTDLIAYLESLGPQKGKFGSRVSGPVTLPAGFQFTTIATGLSGAVAMEIAPDGRIFVCEQGGTLRVIKDGKLLPDAFVSIPVEKYWERGLIGVTVAPDFPDDPYVYVVYVTDEPHTHHRVSRFRASGDVAVAGSEEILLHGDDQSQFGGNVPAGHQGGAIHFGSDGKLYIGIGEQTAKTPSQRLDALQGKILRINPDGSIPNDNPFLNQTDGKYRSIWAMGCRNPFTFGFSENGDMLINDVGGIFEEINRGVPGANYGWPIVDHGPTDRDEFTGPIHIYPQSSINGGDFCSTSSPWPKRYHGKYFFADFVHGWIKYIDPKDPERPHEFLSGIRRPVDLRFAPDGSLYILLRNAWVVDDEFVNGTGALVRIQRK